MLRQVIRETERLCELEHLVPKALLWDRPPGLPSGAELLWLVHLVDEDVFIPSALRAASNDDASIDPPDYLVLLNTHPCEADTLAALHDRIQASRERLIGCLEAAISADTNSISATFVETVTNHDRQLLAAFAERMYESGMGT